MRHPHPSLPLLALLLLALSAGCAGRQTVVVDGVEVDYEAAAAQAWTPVRAAHEAGRHEEAAEGARDFLQRFPRARQADEARLVLGRSLVALDRVDEATRVFQDLLARKDGGTAPQARLELARLHQGAGRPQQAVAVLQPAYDRLRGGERLAAARLLVQASLQLEDWPAAVRWQSEVLAQAESPEQRSAAESALKGLIDTSLPDAALVELREDLDDRSPGYPMVLAALARARYRAGQWRQAEGDMREYLSRWPDGPAAGEFQGLLARLRRLSEVRPGVVGVILPLSGRYQAFGEAVMRGLGMALDPTGGRSGVTLVIRDSAGDPEQAARAVEELVLEEQAVAIIGPLLTSTADAAANKAEELMVPLLALARTEGLPQVGPWVFRNALTNAAQTEALVAFAAEELGARSFGVIYPKHGLGTSMMQSYWDEVDARRLEMRAAEDYEPDQTTFSSDIRSMVGREHLQYRDDYAQAVQEIRRTVTDPYRRRKALERARADLAPITDFDVLFIPDSYRAVSLIAPALAVEDVLTNVCDEDALDRTRRTTGRELRTVRLLGANTWHHPDLVTRAGRYVQCAIFVDGFFAESTRPATAAFVQQYVNLFGGESMPSYLEAIGYDSARIVGQVISDAAPRDRAAFREALLGVRDFPGATGDTSFDADGEVVKPLFFLTVSGDAIVELGSEDAAPPAP